MRKVILLIALLALALPASAAASGRDVIKDCMDDGQIEGHYSQQEYSQALAHMPSDVQEYSDCASQIRQAQLAAASGGGGGSGPGGGGGAGGGSGAGGTGAPAGATAGSASAGSTGAPPYAVVRNSNPLGDTTRQERQALKNDQAGAAKGLRLGGPGARDAIRAGQAGLTARAGGGSSLPTPVIAAIVVLGAALLAGAGVGVRNLVNAHRAS